VRSGPDEPLFISKTKPDGDLCGESSRIWSAVQDAARGGPLFSQFESWWSKAGNQAEFYRNFAAGESEGDKATREQARSWVEAPWHIACALDMVRGVQPDRAGALANLDAAVGIYGRILGWAGRPARGDDVETGSVGELDFDRLDARDRAARLLATLEHPGRYDAGHPGVGMVRAALDFAYGEGSLLGARSNSIKVKVLFDETARGSGATLVLERFNSGAGIAAFFPDPARLGCVVLDDDFRWALLDAWALAQSRFSGGYIRWHLASWGKNTHLKGGSLGAAFAAALLGLAEHRSFDAGTAISAALSDRAAAAPRGPVAWPPVNLPNGWLYSVTINNNKLNAAQKQELGQIVLCPHDHELHKYHDGVRVRSAKTVQEAIQLLTGQVREVRDFLVRLRRNSLLSPTALVAKPDWVDHENAGDFFLTPRVIDEESYLRALRENQNGGARLSFQEPDSHSAPSDEAYLRAGGSRGATRALDQVLRVRSHRPVVILGEPGEGKTTALGWHVASVCDRLIKALDQGALSMDRRDFRVPLPLALGELDVTRSPLDATGQAVEKVLHRAFGASPRRLVPAHRAASPRGSSERSSDASSSSVSTPSTNSSFPPGRLQRS
jgi:hypothetical protein